MGKTYYETVFEGKYDIIIGMLEGFLLGSGKKWEWYPSKDSCIEAETFTDIIREWSSLKTGLHHIILEADFVNALQESLKNRSDLHYLKMKYTRSAREIKSCSFRFSASAYARKYADEIKEIMATTPDGIFLDQYNPVEEIDETVKGAILYAPVHDYTFKCSGKAIGKFDDVILFRKKLTAHPLVEVENIKLNF